jgi:hypothetical protein
MVRSGEWFVAQAHNAIRHGMASRGARETVERRRCEAWSGLDRALRNVRLPRGYRLALLMRDEIPALVGAIKAWFPEIEVGAASCYLDPEFFRHDVMLAGDEEKDVLVVLIKKGDELAGLFSCERERQALSLYARLGAIAPAHRGKRLCHVFPALAEAIGRAIGMGMVYGMATLKFPNVQRSFEKFGWDLIGITPGYDRELVSPGVVKRVYEAVYAKVLVAERNLLPPQARNLTRRTRAFFELLFPRQKLQRA